MCLVMEPVHLAVLSLITRSYVSVRLDSNWILLEELIALVRKIFKYLLFFIKAFSSIQISTNANK